MRAFASALTVAALGFSAGLATPGATHAASSGHHPDGRSSVRKQKIAKVVAFARHQIGVPYAWGGTSRRHGGFDCSGLVYAAFRSIGRTLPRTSYGQMRLGRRVSWRGLRAGDLAFTNGGGHVVLVASRTTAISAPRRGTRVRFVRLTDIRSEFVGGRRLIAE
jgi:cell wall-associated NlpC family hydrolase